MPPPAIPIDAIRQPAWVYGPDGRVTAANDLAVARAGQPLVGSSIAEVGRIFAYRHADGTPFAPAELPASRAFAGDEVVDLPVTVALAGGSEREIVATASPIREGDAITGALVVWQDGTLRVRAEEAVRASEAREKVAVAIAAERQRLYEMLETLPTLVCLLTLDHHVAFANRRYREMFGECEGRHCYEINFGFTEPCPFCEAYSVLETGQPHQWECVTPAGRTVEVFNVPFTDVDGTPMVLEMDIDVTDQRRIEAALREANLGLDEHVRERTADLEDANVRLRDEIAVRRRAEEAVLESERLYRRLFETMLLGVVYQDADGRIIAMNPAAERILGKSPAEFLGGTSVEEEHHTLREDGTPFPGLEHPAMVALRTGEEVRDVVMGVYNPRERAYRWISITAVPLFHDGETAPYQVYTLFADITDQRRAETALAARDAALRRGERRYRALVENAPDAIYVNRGDRVEYINPAGLRLFGAAAPEEIVGRPVLDLFAPAYRALVTGRIQTLRAGSAVPLVDEQIVRLDGTLRDVEVAAFPFEDEAGPAIEVILRDVTDRKEVERRMQKYAARLKTSNEELQRFAYVASHDLQEPLRSIVSFSQLLERRYKGKLDQDADEYIGFIVDGGTRMQRLILDLLTFSRVETTAGTPVPTDPREAVAAARRSLGASLEEAGGRIEVGELPAVVVDPLQLEQVFANLLSNAVKYRRPDVPLAIAIRARRLDGTAEFSVQDNGIGIEPEYYDRIFEMFRRLHTHDKYDGTGIGLAVVKRIVERHGGTVRVESTPGEGSTFFFTLPAA